RGAAGPGMRGGARVVAAVPRPQAAMPSAAATAHATARGERCDRHAHAIAPRRAERAAQAPRTHLPHATARRPRSRRARVRRRARCILALAVLDRDDHLAHSILKKREPIARDDFGVAIALPLVVELCAFIGGGIRAGVELALRLALPLKQRRARQRYSSAGRGWVACGAVRQPIAAGKCGHANNKGERRYR